MSPLLMQGLNLTVFGMGTVVVFLSLLILVTRCMSALVLRSERGKSDQYHSLTSGDQMRAAPGQSSESTADQQRLRVVIAMAIKQYRDTHG